MKNQTKKLFTIGLIAAMLISAIALTGCGESTQNTSDSEASTSTSTPKTESVSIKPSPDKYTWYIKDYVRKNCASFGYSSMGGDRRDTYGAGNIELIFVTPDGSYIDIENEDALKEYVVTGQNLPPNTEMKYTFDVDSNGNEYENLVRTSSYEEIVLNVKKVNENTQNTNPLIKIEPSPDKYTHYVSTYVGRNLADAGYISLGGELRAHYGAGNVKIIPITEDGSFISMDNDGEELKNYVVLGQNPAPNTPITYTFSKDSNGKEYDNLVSAQSIESIELQVKKLQ